MLDAAIRRRSAHVCTSAALVGSAALFGFAVLAGLGCGGAGIGSAMAAEPGTPSAPPGAGIPSFPPAAVNPGPAAQPGASAGVAPNAADPAAVENMSALNGISLAGAEFGEGSLPGSYGASYVYPTMDEAAHFIDMGMRIIRLPFRWERLQPTLSGELDGTERYRIDTLVSFITSKGAYVLLDPHNYARYYDEVIGDGVPTAAFADFWSRLASLYKDNDHVIFGLMNEPNTMPTELWLGQANAAIAAIRATGAANAIFVPGNAWTGAWSWSANTYGTPNATVMLGIDDPLDNFAIEVHQYLDPTAAGTEMASCVSSTVGSERLKDFTAWLAQHNLHGFLGEFAAGTSDTCMQAIDDMLTYVSQNPEQWVGWAYWAAGPWWGGSVGSIEPTSDGQDAPQTAILRKHLGR
jgi:endoglucanase